MIRLQTTHIQGDSGRICNTLGNDSMCDSKQKVHMNMGPILNGYRDMACTFPRLNPLGFLFMGMAERGGVPHQSGYTC